MRLIDADAFKEYITDVCEDMKHLFNDGGAVAKLITESFCKDIDEQPTIQPEPSEECERCMMEHMHAMEELETKLAMAEPHEIGYDDCANALLKMWMDNVLTDGDYYRIADKLNKKWGKTELPEPYTEPYKGVTDGRN